MRLYTYFRSSASFRVRIALNLKGLEADAAFVHLRRGEQNAAAYLAVNPQGLVPALEDGGRVLTQSLAIIEYLEETHPRPPLLPSDPAGRARVRALAQDVACDIHPIGNLRVLNHLASELAQPPAAVTRWARHWVEVGFRGLEASLAGSADTGRFCHGDQPTIADLCLVPQVFNARRFECDLAPFPVIRRIFDAAMELPAFQRATPSAQPDAEA